MERPKPKWSQDLARLELMDTLLIAQASADGLLDETLRRRFDALLSCYQFLDSLAKRHEPA